jgi:hypothetical protein
MYGRTLSTSGGSKEQSDSQAEGHSIISTSQAQTRLGSSAGAVRNRLTSKTNDRPGHASRLGSTLFGVAVGGSSVQRVGGSSDSVADNGSGGHAIPDVGANELTFRKRLLKHALQNNVARPRGVFALHIKTGRFYDIDSHGWFVFFARMRLRESPFSRHSQYYYLISQWLYCCLHAWCLTHGVSLNVHL